MLCVSCFRGHTVEETKATLKVVRTRVKRVLMYTRIENAALCLLPWTQAVIAGVKRVLIYTKIENASLCSYHGHKLS